MIAMCSAGASLNEAPECQPMGPKISVDFLTIFSVIVVLKKQPF